MYLVRGKTVSVLWSILSNGLAHFIGRDTLDEDDVDWTFGQPTPPRDVFGAGPTSSPFRGGHGMGGPMYDDWC